MANTDWTRLLDGHSLLAIKSWAEGKFAPLNSPTFTGTVEIPTSFKVTGLTSTGLLKYTWDTTNNKAVLSIDTTSYLSSQTWRAIQVDSTTVLAANTSTALKFVNGTHSVQFTYSSGLYAEVNLKNYKPNGNTAFLDSNNKVSTSYLPDSVLGQLEYKGVWDATSTTTSTPQKGWYYICSVAGNRNPDGSQSSVTYNKGDWAVYNGSSWDKVDNTDAITGIILVEGDPKTAEVTIPLASSSAYGLIKVGYSTSDKNYAVQLDSSGKAYVNVPWTDNDHNYYHTPSYAAGLKIGTGTGVNDLYVPVATASAYGVIKVYAVRASSITATTGGTTSNRYYGVELDSNGKAFVNVPWTDNNDNYYPSRLFTTGLQISTSVGNAVTALYVPNADTGQAGIVTTAAQSFSGKKLFVNGIEVHGSEMDSYYLQIYEDNEIYALMAIEDGEDNDFMLKVTKDGGDTFSRYHFHNEGTSYAYYVATEEWVNANYSRDDHNHDDVYVKYFAAQTLTDAQKTQARTNIGAASSGHTHPITLVSGGTATVNLAYNTAYTLTAGGNSVIFKMPASDNTDHYHTPLQSTGLKIATGTGLSDMWVQYATDNLAGVVSTTNQTFAGTKTFNNTIAAKTGVMFEPPTGNTRVNLHYDKPISADGMHNVNVNTYSQNEVTNILNGLNSDGTARS